MGHGRCLVGNSEVLRLMHLEVMPLQVLLLRDCNVKELCCQEKINLPLSRH